MQTDPAQNQNKFYFFGVSYAILIFTLVFNRGIYTFPIQLWLLSVSWLFLFLALFPKIRFEIIGRPKPEAMVFGLVILNFVLYYFFDTAYNLPDFYANYYIFILKLLSLVILSFYFMNFEFNRSWFGFIFGHFQKYKFLYLVLIAVILRFLVIGFSFEPAIDTFWFTDQGAESLLSGKNPYAQEYFPVYGIEYHNDKYVYWPTTIIYSLPFKLLFGDVRYGYAFAQILMGLLLYKLVMKKLPGQKLLAEGLGLLTIYCPLSLYVVDQCWSEPLSMMLLFLFFFLNLTGREKISYFFLGLFSAVKLIFLCFIGFGLFLEKKNIYKYFISVLVSLFVLAPFVIWGFNDFLNDTIISVLKYKPAIHSISFNSPFLLTFGKDFPSMIYILVAAGLFVFLIKYSPKNLAGVLLSMAILLYAIFFLKQGFVNYYYSIAQLLILLLTIDVIQRPKEKNELNILTD